MAKFLLTPRELGTLWLFAGQKRSGKSYHAIEVIDKWTRQGGHVLTNLDIFPPKSWARRKVKIERLSSAREVVARAVSFREEVDGGILVVLDEVASVFDSRKFKEFPGDLRAFLTQHAKMGIHVIAIVHRVPMIDVSFRQMAEYVVEHWSCARFPGVWGLVFGILAPGVMYRHTREMENGEPGHKTYEKRFLIGKQKIYNLYDTLQIVEGSMAGRDALKKALLPSYGFRRKALLLVVIWCFFRFTPLNRSVQADAVVLDEPVSETVKPYGTVYGEVTMIPWPYRGFIDLTTSSGHTFRMIPEPEWGSVDYNLLGRFVSVDIPTTSPILELPYYKEQLDEAIEYYQKPSSRRDFDLRL